MSTCTDILLIQNENTDHLPIIREMRQSVERGADLTKRLLLFSRKQPVQSVSIVLNDHLKNALGFLGRLLKKHITIKTEFSGKPMVILGDPVQIELVLVNLVVNARDAMPNGGVLTIGLSDIQTDAAFRAKHEWARAERYARIFVRDTGIGMDGTTQARMFEPFFTTKPTGKGTGLGLPSVFGIVKQHGGGIVVESELGRGTTFHLHFPLREPETPPMPTVGREYQRDEKNKKIL